MSTDLTCDTHETYEPKKVLAIGAHADDIDFIAGGTVAAWTAQGVHVEYVVITDGCKGTSDPETISTTLIKTRQAEQQAAAALLGVKAVHFLDYVDGELTASAKLKKDLVRLIRQVKPDTVITSDPTFVYSSRHGVINHSDHRAAGQATLDAVYPLARDHLSFPELLGMGFEPHKVAHLLLTNPDAHDCIVDITAHFETKLKALATHQSQFDDIDKLRTTLETHAGTIGKEAKCTYAEGFVRVDCPA